MVGSRKSRIIVGGKRNFDRDAILILPDFILFLSVNNTKSHIVPKKQKSIPTNPFIQMIEDKKKIDQVIEDGNSLSTLKDIKFVKPL